MVMEAINLLGFLMQATVYDLEADDYLTNYNTIKPTKVCLEKRTVRRPLSDFQVRLGVNGSTS